MKRTIVSWTIFLILCSWGWVYADDVSFDLTNGEQTTVDTWSIIAGGSIFDGAAVYVKYDTADAQTEVYVYNADTSGGPDNDTYAIVGIAQEDCTEGNACNVWLGTCRLARRDGFSFTSGDTGKPLFTLTSGWQGLTPGTDSGDHNEMIGIVACTDDICNGDYILYRIPTYRNVVP